MTQGSANPVHWFEIPVDDLPRATAFYEAVIGAPLKPVEQGPYRMSWFPGDFGARGSTGALINGPGRIPGKGGAVMYLTVTNVDDALEVVQARGGKVVMPTTTGEFGAIAHIEDSEGNLVALYARRD
jgi:predicted enzyme related to lactoylglutathione lyase